MARPKKAIQSVEKNISIDKDIVTRIDLELYSELEGRVPHGAWSRLINNMLRTYINALPPASQSPARTLEQLIDA
jgi:hypothetical protein